MHANGLVFRARDQRGNPYLTETYYSVGGGFVLTAQELEAERAGADAPLTARLSNRQRVASQRQHERLVQRGLHRANEDAIIGSHEMNG